MMERLSASMLAEKFKCCQRNAAGEFGKGGKQLVCMCVLTLKSLLNMFHLFICVCFVHLNVYVSFDVIYCDGVHIIISLRFHAHVFVCVCVCMGVYVCTCFCVCMRER